MKTFYLLIGLVILTSLNQSIAQTLKVRKNIKTFSTAQIDTLVNAIIAMKNRASSFDPSVNAYDYFPKIHWEALNGTTSSASVSHKHGKVNHGDTHHIAHSRPGFMPWHREFIRRFEVELRISTGNSSYMLPYWDWTDRSYDDIFFADNFMGKDGDPADDYILKKGRFGKDANNFPVAFDSAQKNPEGGGHNYLQRHWDWSAPLVTSFPTAEDVATSLTISTYDVYPWNAEVNPPMQSFRQFFEGFRPVPTVSPTVIGTKLHNQVHMKIGGHFVSDASPNDPIFWLHHSNIDRIFSQWIDKYGKNKFPTTWVDTAGTDMTLYDTDLMAPFGVSYKSGLDNRTLGYRYDTQSATNITEVRLNNDSKGISINKDDAVADVSAVLDIKSDNQGILIPRITKANRPTTPVAGLLIYQTDNTPGFYFYNGTAWRLLSSVPSSLVENEADIPKDEGESGIGQLTNGSTFVKFGTPQENPAGAIIQLQLEGNGNGLYVAQKTKEGFEVRELQDGKSNTKFSYHIIQK